MAARRRHYQNRIGPGELGFFTFTCLDFAHLFQRPELREVMAASLLHDMAAKGARLHAFVIMTHHVHFVARMPAELDGSRFVQIVKRNAAKRILPLLSERERMALQDQRGLNDRTFWKRSFRSVVIYNHRILAQKVGYVHANPVRAGFCQDAREYRWSSAWLWEEEQFAGALYEMDTCRVLEEFESRTKRGLSGVASTESRGRNVTMKREEAALALWRHPKCCNSLKRLCTIT